ncbi:receptor homology region, transmembrane domain- and RING domain-containing protein 2-like [Impatiens glandulifera]|uniref:receptor homology region, transmembrane domain- and RING domain-containing protein 2-like n=1 Tax=Impatiens glandulifera TaxID=253017 RepID=UPI001FB05563|nr:receptor homology region, transmembrane domain- and RING domain-containing protein 2-like [Impatiens glandulifera]
MSKVKMLMLVLCFVTLMSGIAVANVVIIGNNVTRSFDDFEANFAPSVKGSGEPGMLYLAEPLDACSTLTNKVNRTGKDTMASFALIIRGVCSFEDKVRKAQNAGFKAAIIFDSVDGDLVAMAGNSAGIKTHAVFVSKTSGEVLAKYVGSKDVVVWIVPSFENSAWSIMAISFISLLAMSAVLATCFFVRRHRIRRERPRSSHVREFHGMSSRLVKAMPSLIFTAVLDESCTSTTCAICLEDYTVGEKLRVLPCRHKFHASCVDAWLTTWRTFCPVCKRDARTGTGDPPPSERTPLLSSSSSISIPSTSASSSLASSPAIHIYQSSSSSRPPHSSFPRIHSASAMSSSSYYSRQQQQQQSIQSSHRQTSNYHLSASRSSMDIRNHNGSISSHRSQTSHLASSPQSVAYYPSVSPLNSRYLSPYYPSPVGGSSYIGSSSSRQRNNTLHYSESAASLSPFASAQSLPGC